MQTTGALQLKVIGVLQDAAGDLPSEEQDRLIQEAVRRYSRVRPREIVEDEVGNGTHDLAVTLLASWEEDFSVIRQVEYPVLATTVEPPILERDEWIEYRAPTGRVLRVLEDAPAATETVRITYTALHVADETTFTIPDGDFDAVATWAAALCLRALANKYAQNTAPTLGADSVDHRTMSDQYSRLARELEKDVSRALRIDDNQVGAGSVTTDWPAEQTTGLDWLTHPRRRR